MIKEECGTEIDQLKIIFGRLENAAFPGGIRSEKRPQNAIAKKVVLQICYKNNDLTEYPAHLLTIDLLNL